ncbi:cysteine dioxygenase [Staphylospora marina]|uniref:cysteine dioxygenase n=1 Tax=Staphylospora marina TaxID=2490858 RepID=UPI0013DDCE34|nr:cysteine dioxygenase family protein [Staphylospora marina]
MCLPDRLLKALQSLRQPSSEELERAVRNAGVTLQCVKPYLRERTPPFRYGRNVLLKTGLFEAVVVCLPEHVETPVHGHGDSICCVQVLEGTVTNRLRSPDAPEEIVDERTFRSGEFLHTLRGQIHSMYNPGPGRAVTLHLYTPPLPETAVDTTSP